MTILDDKPSSAVAVLDTVGGSKGISKDVGIDSIGTSEAGSGDGENTVSSGARARVTRLKQG